MQTLWIALSLTSRVGSKTLRALFDHFGGDPQAILSADEAALREVPGIGPKTARSIQSLDLERIEQALEHWASAGISITTVACPGDIYPPPLLSIDDPPPTLFVRGTWQRQYENAVAVVGTRTPSPLAEDIAYELGKRLAQRGITLVSGLAAGVDTLAHQGALSVAGGTSIAVLGSGVMNIYPEKNLSLAQQCEQRGLLISEVAPGTAPNASRLVARNRITSGLSRAVIIVETEADGGAMHAARFAQAQGRPVYVIGLSTSGNQALIEHGAQPLHPDLSDLNTVFEYMLEG